MAQKRIVVIGGGFAGLNFVRQLFHNRHYEVILVDKNNYNYFTPLLYQVATSFLEPTSISYPFRKLLAGKDIGYRFGEVARIAAAEHRLYFTDGGELAYDHLVIAAGTRTNFFGNAEIQENAYNLKEINDALTMRDGILRTLEKAAQEANEDERRRLCTVVIAGGGPTGVEVAGMMAEMKAYVFAKDYPEIAATYGRIYVVDHAPNLLAPMSDKSHAAAFKALTKRGVEVRLNTLVKSYNNGKVHLSDGTVIPAGTLIWAAGVTAIRFEGIVDTSLGKGGRLLTDGYGKVSGYDDIYAIGDIALMSADAAYPGGHPQLAQPAIQQGGALAKNFIRVAKGKKMVPFKYFDKGEMAIIGREYAVADLFKHRVHLGGLLGLFSWLFIHLASLVNYNNKIKTLYNWVVAYLTRDQAMRLIFGPGKKS